MPERAKRPLLLACLLVLTFLPLLGWRLRSSGSPPGYGVFPPLRPGAPAPGFDPTAFAIAAAIGALVVLFLLAPRLFGFRRPERVARAARGPFPHWFAPGIVVMLVSWGLMWFGPPLLARYTFVPLWWGLIFCLDGLVFALTGGVSIVAARRHEMLVLAVVSVVGWYLFEYWNYFVLGNWFYPHAGLLSPFGNLAWYSLSYTTVWPSCFEWYMLLAAIPALRLRYTDGPKLAPRRGLLLALFVGGAAATVLMAAYPRTLFWLMWVGSVAMLGAALELVGFWTPFDPARRGDWSRFVLMALATLANGVLWEGWNYGSEAFRHGVAANPNYWVYSIPYVNVVHLFSEMPLVGYVGYLFFGLLVWVYWLVVAHVIDVDPDFAHREAVGETVS